MEFCTPYLLIILLILTQVATAQEGPGIVIAHPGQDVKLLCTVNVTDSTSQTTGWLVNNEGPYRINAIRSHILTGYSATLDSTNLIVQNVTINDVRNGSEYSCVIVPVNGMIALANIIDESDPTTLYVAGIPSMVLSVTVNDNTININGNSITLTLSWGEPFNNLDPIVNYTVSCSGDVTCPPNFITTDNTTRSYTITNLTPMTNYVFSVVATNSIGSGEAGIVMITTPPGNIITTNTVATTSSMGMTTTTSSVDNNTTTSSVENTVTTSSVGMTTTTTTSSMSMATVTATTTVSMTDATTSGESGDAITISIIVFGIVLIILYCCLVFLFCYCCKRKARHYQDKEFCDVSRKSLIMNVILGVFTFGISIVVWYVYVKCKDNDKDDDEYCRIVHVSIIVLGIYTFGTSLLLWWLCTKLAKCCFSGDVKDDPKGVSNKLAEREYVNKLADREYVNKLAKSEYDDEYEYEDVDIPRDPIHHSRYPQGNLYTNNNQRSASTKTNQRGSAPWQTAVDDARWPVSTTANQPSAETTAGGVPYAVFRDNPRSHGEMKNKKLKYADLDLDQPYENFEQPSTYKNVKRDTPVEYAYVQVT